LANLKLVASPAVGGAAYFFYGHCIVLVGCVSGVVWYRMKKRQNMETCQRQENVCIADPSVLKDLMVDAREFGEQRVRDVQAIQVAASRFNPNAFVGQMTTGGMMIAQGQHRSSIAASSAP